MRVGLIDVRFIVISIALLVRVAMLTRLVVVLTILVVLVVRVLGLTAIAVVVLASLRMSGHLGERLKCDVETVDRAVSGRTRGQVPETRGVWGRVPQTMSIRSGERGINRTETIAGRIGDRLLRGGASERGQRMVRVLLTCGGRVFWLADLGWKVKRGGSEQSQWR